MITRTLTPKQEALQRLALNQLRAAAGTIKRLQAVPSSQADREAVDDAQDWLSKATSCIGDWFGGCPFDDVESE